MTSLLKKAFEEASRLPTEEQDPLAKLLLSELKSERQWDQVFASSGDRLSELADEALKEKRDGDTLDYRALGVRDGDEIVWFWIGSHADYDKLV